MDKKKVINEFKKLGKLDSKLIFACYVDHMASYYLYEEDGSFHEINIIHDIATLLDEMDIESLLQGDIIYFSHRYFYAFDPITDQHKDCDILFEYRQVDDEKYIKQQKQITNN